MASISTREAARRLGVSDRRVRSLIERGDLDATRAGHVHQVDAQSLARLGAIRAAGRSMSPRMSWAVLLSDLGTSNVEAVVEGAGLSRSERTRLLNSPRRQVEDWSWLVRRRGQTRRYSVREVYLSRLLVDERVVRSGVSAMSEYDVGLSQRAGMGEVYLDRTDLGGIEADYLLRADSAGGLVVHVIDAHLLLGYFRSAPTMTAATVGVDLAENDDTRTRRAGYHLLHRLTSG